MIQISLASPYSSPNLPPLPNLEFGKLLLSPALLGSTPPKLPNPKLLPLALSPPPPPIPPTLLLSPPPGRPYDPPKLPPLGSTADIGIRSYVSSTGDDEGLYLSLPLTSSPSISIARSSTPGGPPAAAGER
jgi:hypothetical protein